jgi:hypothetical protein
MTPSPRELANRLGINQLAPAQAAYWKARAAADFVLSPEYFSRGYRFAQRLAPRPNPPMDEQASTSPLESYAIAHRKGPGIYKWQHYFDIYDRHLSRFRGTDVHVVEIGVAAGGSLGMWSDYLGPDAHIVGIDIDPECSRFTAPSVEIVIGDQGSETFWSEFLAEHPRIDVVIDDGSHLAHHQTATLEALMSHISPGGVYVCEDIHGPFHPFHAFVDGLTRRLSTIAPAPAVVEPNPLQSRVSSVHRYPILTVIELAAGSQTAYECRRYGTEWPEDWASASRNVTSSGV